MTRARLLFGPLHGDGIITNAARLQVVSLAADLSVPVPVEDDHPYDENLYVYSERLGVFVWTKNTRS
jgi:hypothetical protein